MTDFLKIDLTIATTRGGHYKSIGFDIQEYDWEDVKKNIMKKSNNTVEIRKEEKPRNSKLDETWFWVWITWAEVSPPIDLLMYLQELKNDLKIKPDPHQFP